MKKKTNEEFLKEVTDKFGEGYELLNNYESYNKKVKMRHVVCGHEWEIQPQSLLRKSTCCPKCNSKTNKGVRKTPKEFEEEVKNLTNNDYEILTPYKNADSFVKMKHVVCGHEWDVKPHYFLRGTRCPKCSHRSYKKTHEEFVQEALEKRGDKYTVIGKYKNNSTPIEIKCNNCDSIWSPPPVKFLAGRNCPFCCDYKNSEGMRMIEQFLKDNEIKYTREKTFNTCKNINLLPFDFYLTDIDLLIEYDGEFHDRGFNSNKESLEKVKLRDSIKTKWCEDNNKKLLRLNYKDKNSNNLIQKLKKALNW